MHENHQAKYLQPVAERIFSQFSILAAKDIAV